MILPMVGDTVGLQPVATKPLIGSAKQLPERSMGPWIVNQEKSDSGSSDRPPMVRKLVWTSRMKRSVRSAK